MTPRRTAANDKYHLHTCHLQQSHLHKYHIYTYHLQQSHLQSYHLYVSPLAVPTSITSTRITSSSPTSTRMTYDDDDMR